jgi:transcriptional regulator with XRE-family HTH domain
MGSEFGQFCRTLRKRRGLTQIELAGKAALAVRTLIYWETGQREPRGEELSGVLQALNVTPAERDQAYLLLTSSHGIQLIRQRARTQTASNRTNGVLPDLGDLIAALRIRKGWPRERLAAQMQVKVSTVIGWERTQHLPNDENIDRMCAMLDAYPEERAALLTRRLSSPAPEQSPSLEVYAERVRAFVCDVDLQRSPLIDLHALALKKQLWFAAESHDHFNLLAAHVETLHCAWLFYQTRTQEAGRCINRALNLVRPRLAECDFVPTMLNLASCHAVEKQGRRYDEGIELLRRWLPRVTRPDQLAPIYCDLAYYASAAGQHEAALNYLQHARNSIAPMMPTSELLSHFGITLARVLAQAGKVNQALEVFPNDPDLAGNKKLFRGCIRAEMLWKANLRSEAHDAVQDLYSELSRFSSPLIQKRVDRLAGLM